MKGRFIEMLGGKGNQSHNFDRNKLVEGYTLDGKFVPAGGVVLHNGTLAGYVQAGGEYEKPTWRIIGVINKHDPNYKYITKYNTSIHKQKGGDEPRPYSRNHKRSLTRKSRNLKGGKKTTKTERTVSLKTAVKMMREYYRHNFN